MPRSNRGISAACFAAALTAAAQVSAEGRGDIGYYAASQPVDVRLTNGAAKTALGGKSSDDETSDNFSVGLTVSPNPFSPYIHPVKEYGQGQGYMSRADVPAGTCIKVNVEAPRSPIESLKLQIHNAAGKRVWAASKSNTGEGDHKIWWDGRTTSREEAWWGESLSEQNGGKGRMCENGRYFVTATVTDMEGRKRRVMKQIVLMK